MSAKTPFGHPMRSSHFDFSATFTPLNHGSFGAYPRKIQDAQDAFQRRCHSRPDPFIKYDLPKLIDESRRAIVPLLGVDVDEVVFVPNATTGVNVVLRNLKWKSGDVVVHFDTIYGACAKTLSSIKEHEALETINITLEYPVTDQEIVRRFKEAVKSAKADRKNVRLALFDTVSTFPGVRFPWEDLVHVCKEMEVLSLVDGSHSIGQIDLSHLGEVGPDFFFSNCHKWLYTPRVCAVLYVPFRNQHLIRTSIPTGQGYKDPTDNAPASLNGKTDFVELFDFVATYDFSAYLCVPAALEFRKKVCGGEEAIRQYCEEIARLGGARTAEILGTEVLGDGFEGSRMQECSFSNVRLPLTFVVDGGEGVERNVKGFKIKDAGKISQWLKETAFKDFDTYLQISFHASALFVRLSGQIYLELQDFEWVGYKLKELCERVKNGDDKLARYLNC